MEMNGTTTTNNNNNHPNNTSAKVIIVGAGPSGIATSALLKTMSIPNMVFEREDCCASLWKKRSYDRLNLHLTKNYCSLPMMSHPLKTSIFMSKDDFIRYIDEYVERYNVTPRYCHEVESAVYQAEEKKWKVTVKDITAGIHREYFAEFLVVASGENTHARVPGDLPGLETFAGQVVHAQDYKCGSSFRDKKVLVIGCGNSGMEISNDLAENGAHVSIVVRSQIHVLSREMVGIAMLLWGYLPVKIVDTLVCLLAKIRYGDLSKYGIPSPAQGPFALKKLTGKSPVIDRGTIAKIRSKKIQVFPKIVSINERVVEFKNDGAQAQQCFDAIVLATGYKSVAHRWLKGYDCVLNDDGKPKGKCPNHWKGEKGVYCVGLTGLGLPGISTDSMAIAEDINRLLSMYNNNNNNNVDRLHDRWILCIQHTLTTSVLLSFMYVLLLYILAFWY